MTIMAFVAYIANGFQPMSRCKNNVYTIGITRGAFSYSTAVGLFKGIIGIILIYSANYLAKKAGESGLF